MGIIGNLDNAIFEAINMGLSNEFFDIIVPWLRNKYFWIPLYIFLIAHSIFRHTQQAYMIIITAVLTIVLADQLSATIMKPAFHRERPCNNEALIDINILAPCRNSFSFPSSHATNHFAIAAFFSLAFFHWKKIWKILLLVWAGLICFAQIYVGLHYFTDVLAGSILGLIIAKISYFFLSKYYLRQSVNGK